jgi:hypothetical protein
VGLALVRPTSPGVNATTAAYIGVTGVDDLHERCAARRARIVTSLVDHPWGLRDFVSRCPVVTGWHSASRSHRPHKAALAKAARWPFPNYGRDQSISPDRPSGQ